MLLISCPFWKTLFFFKFDVQLQILSNCNSSCFKDEEQISEIFKNLALMIVKRAIWLDLPKKNVRVLCCSEYCYFIKLIHPPHPQPIRKRGACSCVGINGCCSSVGADLCSKTVEMEDLISVLYTFQSYLLWTGFHLMVGTKYPFSADVYSMCF